MAPETGTALLILVAFVLPGFVTLFISERTYTVRRDDSPYERLLQASYYAALTYLIVGALAWLFGFERADVRALRHSESSLGKLVLIAVFVVFVVPFVIAHASRVVAHVVIAAPLATRQGEGVAQPQHCVGLGPLL